MELKIFQSIDSIKKYKDSHSGSLISIYDGEFDFPYLASWLNSSAWKIHQGILLINGFPPDMFQFINRLSDLRKYCGFTEYFKTSVTPYRLLEILRYVEQDLELGEFPLAKKDSELVEFRDFINWAYDKNIPLPEIFNQYVTDTDSYEFEQGSKSHPCMKEDNPFYAPELATALDSWEKFYADPSNVNRHKGQINQIVEWLKKHHPELSTNARKRIATVINTKDRKEGGCLPLVDIES